MNFLKKNSKLMIGIIIGMLLTSSISVYATYSYFATDVKYARNEQEMNVAQALNELYENKKDTSELANLKAIISQTDATASDISSGKKAYTKDGLITGTSNYYTNANFTVKPGWNHYSLGFEPSMMFYYSSDGVSWGVKEDTSLYYVTNNGSYGSNPGNFLTKSDGIDLYYSGTAEVSGITFYAVK